MAHKSIAYPPQLVTSGNEIPLIVNVANAFVTPEANPYARLCLEAYHEAGDTISFVFADETITFTCVTPYTGAANTYPLHTTESLFAWGAKVLSSFQRCQRIVDNYIMYVRMATGEYNIYFEPYTKSIDYNFTLSLATSASYLADNLNYTPAVYYTNFKLSLQLFLYVVKSIGPGLEKYRSQVIFPLIYNGSTASVYYDLRRLAYSEYSGHFTFPVTTFDFKRHNILQKIYMQLGFLADNLTPELLSVDNFFYTLPGKLPVSRIKEFNDSGYNFYTWLFNGKRFLSFAPLEKQTDIYSPEKLYFIFQNAADIYVRVKETYSDNTTETRDFINTTVASWSLYEFCIGFQQIKKAEYTKLPVKYEVWIEDETSVILSEVRTFVLDYAYKRFARYFLFKNSFGVFEIFRSTGDAEKQLKIEKEFYEPFILQPESRTHLRKQIDEKTEYAFKINSGILTTEWNNHFIEEFLRSPEVYQLRLNKIYGGAVADGNFNIQKSGKDSLHDFDFIFMPDDTGENFYADYEFDIEPPILGDFNYDYSDDYNR